MMTEEQKNQLLNRSTYIRLRNAQQSGNKVDYVYIEGDEAMVDKIGRALGLVVSVTSLEVKHA